MKEQRYTYETTITIGKDVVEWEGDVVFSFAVGAWGEPSKTYGRPEDCYEGWDTEIDDVQLVSVEGVTSGWSEYESDKDFAESMVLHLTDADYARMREIAEETRADEYERAMEARWEARRDDGDA